MRTRQPFSRDEKLLMFGQGVSTVGDYMALPAFLKLALERGPEVPSLFLVLYFLPRAVQPFFGLVVDVLGAKPTLLVTETLRVVLCVALYSYPRDGPTGVWLALALASAVGSCLFEPARLTLMSALTTNFVRLNSAFSLFFSAAGIFSVSVSLITERVARSETVFLVNALTFLVSLCTILPMAGSPRRTTRTAVSSRAVLSGFAYVSRHGAILCVVAAIVVVDFFTGVLYDFFPRRSVELGIADYGTYLFTMVVCVGNAVGSPLIGFVYRSPFLWAPLTALAVVLAAVTYSVDGLLVGLVTVFGFAVIQMVLIGVSEAAIEETAPVGIQGRLFAINEAAPLVALSAGGVISGSLGLPGVLWSAGLLSLGFVVVRRLALRGSRCEGAPAAAEGPPT